MLLAGPVVSLGLTAAPAAAAPGGVYIALGDSIAAGLVTTLPRDRGYPALVEDLYRSWLAAQGSTTSRLANLGVAGETATSFVTGGQLDRFAAEVKTARSDGSSIQLVSVSLGGNDILRLSRLAPAQRQAGLDQFRASYPAALTAIRNALGDVHPTMVVTTYYDLSETDPTQHDTDAWWLGQFNQVIRDTAAAQGMRVADLEPAFRGHIKEWTWNPTDVHPNNAGHVEIARMVWQAGGIDTQPPTVTIERPSAGQLDRRVPTIRAMATDPVGIDTVDVWVGDQRVAELIRLTADGVYSGIWDARSYDAQSAVLSVRAVDRGGIETRASVTVTLPQK
jgi:lysophospholipase L1-like esterase